MTFQSLPAIAKDDLRETGVDDPLLQQSDQLPNTLNKTVLPTNSFTEQSDAFDDGYYREMIRLEKEKLYQEHIAKLGLEYSISLYTESKEKEYIPPTADVIAETQAQVRSFDCSTVTDVPKIECEALVALYESTNGAGWRNQSNWLRTTTVANWDYVTVEDGHVVELMPGGNYLVGTIPSELGNLEYLESLGLGYNTLSGSIPSELGNLTNLTHLSLNQNNLSGSIPSSLGNLVKISHFRLDNNQLTGSIPSELGNLIKSYYFYLDNNQLSGSIPESLGNLSGVYVLGLSYNALTGAIPNDFGNFISIHRLDLNNNQLSDSIPAELGNLGRLQYLYLQNNLLTGSIPPELGNMYILSYMDLYNNNLTGSIPSEISQLSNLDVLRLQNNNLSGSIPLELTSLRDLDYFYFYNTNICEPDTSQFFAWKNSIDYWEGTGEICPTYEISGQIHDDLGNPAELIKVHLSDGKETYTDFNGNYKFTVFDSGVYIVNPYKLLFRFAPELAFVTLPGDSQQDFIIRPYKPEPFMDLPFNPTSYEGFSETESFAISISGNIDRTGNFGKVNSWFDHEYPTYTGGVNSGTNNIRLWNNIEYDFTLKDSIQGISWYDGHDGIDFHIAEGQEIRAVDGGEIIGEYTGWGCLGWHVTIDHQNGYFTVYGHLRNQPTVTGHVNQGDVIGVSGSTFEFPCSSSGPHLHFAVYYDANGNGEFDSEDRVVDPFGWKPQNSTNFDPWIEDSFYLWKYDNTLQCSVPPTGSILSSPTGFLTIQIPDGAVPSIVSLEILDIPPFSNPLSNYRFTGQSFLTRIIEAITNEFLIESDVVFENQANFFLVPINLIFKFYPSQISHLDISEIGVFEWNNENETWVALDSEIDTINNTVNASSTNLGNYTLQAPLLCSNAVNEPNDNFDAATVLNVDGNPTSDNFDIETDEDWFKFSVKENKLIEINTLLNEPNISVFLEIIDKDGVTPLASENNPQGMEWQAPSSGTYFIRITRQDSSSFGCDSIYNISLTPIPIDPIANAGSDQFVEISSLVTLDGSLSFDPDNDLPLSYEWTQLDGSGVTLFEANSANPTFVAPNQSSSLVFSLIVTDSLGMISNPDTVTISVIVEEESYQYIPLILH